MCIILYGNPKELLEAVEKANTAQQLNQFKKEFQKTAAVIITLVVAILASIVICGLALNGTIPMSREASIACHSCLPCHDTGYP